MMKHIMGKNSRSTITDIEEGDIQPNAVDLRVDKIFEMDFDPTDYFEISETSKKHRKIRCEILPDAKGYFNLGLNCYQIVMKNIVHIGENEAGWVITRSTLNRNAVVITSGLYDSGYHGLVAAALHVTIPRVRIQKGTRVAQFLLFEAESLKKYDGDYGLAKEHDKKYE